ncbi:MAG: 5-(carboxyamino)imidazole ribonucleotide synthase [Gemmatimonadales bacterium]|nr:MAG: 5-(carboxyamino)imidazole ribonucleotide synthase [Gemmatimonadales bacterium]
MSLPDSGRGPLVAIVGGGQLGRMLALAGLPLGLRFRFLEPNPDPPVAHLGEVMEAAYDDPQGLDRLVHGASVVTYEFENVPVEAASRLSRAAPVHPAPAALAMAQDRLTEKEAFQALGIETAPFRPVDSRAGLDAAIADLGLPAVLKTRRMGYDGKGQAVLRTPDDVEPAWERLGGRPLILEGFVPFHRELSILAVRGLDGEMVEYPLVENHHEAGILVRSLAPAPQVDDRLQEAGRDIARRVLEHLDYVGVLAVELFQVGERLLANEMAPRVHNSGHWTQDGAITSQFENHLRAILGLPLGSTRVRGARAAMVNLLGDVPPRDRILGIPGVSLHLYDKEPRPGRKVGHINVVDAGGQGWDGGSGGEDHDFQARLLKVQSLIRDHGEVS